MAKKVVGQVKLQIAAGAANPSPPVGPALGQRGVNIMEFCKAFNAQTQNMQGLIIPVILTVFADRVEPAAGLAPTPSTTAATTIIATRVDFIVSPFDYLSDAETCEWIRC